MNLYRVAVKQLIVSNSSESIIFKKKHSVSLNNEKESFMFDELVSIEEYQTDISEEDFQFIKNELNFFQGLVTYKSVDHLSLYIKDTIKHVLVFAIGEIQPGLYKIFLEGAFQKSPKEFLQ